MTGLRARLIAAAAAVALLASGCGISLQSLPKPSGAGGPTYTLHATFDNVVNLPDDAPVRVGAFVVGYVSGLSAKDFKALVTLKIKQSQKLPTGTTAQVRFDTPLGEDYVALDLPTNQATTAASTTASKPAFLPPGGTLSATRAAPSVEDVFAALGGLLNGGGLDQLQTIITELNKAFTGNQPQIHDLLTQLDTAVSSFAAHAPQLDAALTSVGSLSQTLNTSQATIVAGINALAPAVATLQQNSAALTSLVNNVAHLSDVANSVVVQSRQGLRTTLVDLAPVLDQLTSVSGQLGPALNAITELEARMPSAAPGNYLQVALTANVQVPAVPGNAPALNRVTVDPPDPNESYARSGIATILEGGLP